MPQEEVISSGMVERIGLENAQIHYKTNTTKITLTEAVPTHKEGLQTIVKLLLDSKIGVLKNADVIDVVGHRVVHGGSTFAKTTLIDEKVKKKINDLAALAPLHNPPNLEGIIVAEQLFPKAKQVAVFDTAFHQSIPQKAYQYAIPTKFLDDNQIRLYGFHGTSHKYVSEKAIAYLGLKHSKLISIHLGNGCSMTAIKDGKSVDHSLGFGPMNGLIMGTRSGDIDQSVIFYLVNSLGYTLAEVNTLLQKQSGMYGLTGFSDLRDIESEAEKGNKACQLALDMNAYHIKKYIGAYVAALNGVDALIFTAGIGEHSDVMRHLICNEMEGLGIDLNQDKNKAYKGGIEEIQLAESKVKILIVPTNEEIEIAQQSFFLIKDL
jgi:acetate kinase